METIGRATVHLFELLNQPAAQVVPLSEMVILQEEPAIPEDVASQKTAEQVAQMIEAYQDQIRLLEQSIEQEQNNLSIQKKIEGLQSFEKPVFLGRASDPEQEILARIGRYQSEIGGIQVKIAGLQDIDS